MAVLRGGFGNRKIGPQVSDDEFREIGTDYGRHGYLAKDSGFYHVGSRLILRGKEWFGHGFLCPSCSKAHRSMWWLNGNQWLLPGTGRSLWGQVWARGQGHSGHACVTYKLSSDWARRLTECSEGV